MNEQRLVTLILVVLLLLGAAGLVAVYFATADRFHEGPPSSSTRQTETALADTVEKVSPQYPVPAARDDAVPLTERPTSEPADTFTHFDKGPPPSSTRQTEASPSLPVAAVRGGSTHSEDKPTKAFAETSLSQRSKQVVIYETSKPNGTFYSSQEISEGVIIGRRGTADDRGDYYKIKATGKTMALRLEPALKEGTHRFIMAVFDKDQKLIGKDSGKTGRTISLAVTPQAIYYIRLDLSKAPVETPPYKIHVSFN